MITFLSNLSRMATSTAFWVSVVLLGVSYLVLARHCTTTKQRSWILTTLSSAAMSLFSLPGVVQFAVARGQLKDVTVPHAFTDSVGRFFQAYLITDLTMGMLFYRSKLNLLTGWIHHSVYVFIVEYAIQGHWSHIFSMAALMEVPTLILGLGSLTPRLRSDVFFAVCFFTTRIVYHIALCVSLIVQRHEVTNGSYGPAIIMACILPLHVHWFIGCLKGFIKRGNTVEKPALATKQPSNATSIPERPFTPSISGPVTLHASRASLARRRTALRSAVRARWDRIKLWGASGRLSEMQRRVRAALPGRERVYEYVGLDRRGASIAPSERSLESVRQDPSVMSVS